MLPNWEILGRKFLKVCTFHFLFFVFVFFCLSLVVCVSLCFKRAPIPCKKHKVVVVRSWVSTFVLVDLLHKDERWTFPLNGGVINRRGSSLQPLSILVGIVHCRNGHRPSRTLLGPILLEGPRQKFGRRPLGIRPPRDQDLSTFNKNALLSEFEGRVLGATNYFLGIKKRRNCQNNSLFISQEKYVGDIL